MRKFRDSKRSAFLVASLLVASAFGTVALAGSTNATALSTQTVALMTTDGSSACPLLSPYATWTPATDTCLVAAPLDVLAGETLDVGTGVTLTLQAGSTGLSNLGTVNNEGYINGDGNPGIKNNGTINNAGIINVTSGASEGVANGGTIDNAGTLIGISGVGNAGVGQVEVVALAGISNFGTINNAGTLNGTAIHGTTGIYNAPSVSFYINNDLFHTAPGVIFDYCGVAPTSIPPLTGVEPTGVSCYVVTFDQSGIPAGVAWGLSASWGPFVIPLNSTTDGGSVVFGVNTTLGSLVYSYKAPSATPGTQYDCVSGCRGTDNVGAATAFRATFASALPETFLVLQSDFSTLQSDLMSNFTSISGGISGIQSGLSGVSTALSGISTGLASGFSTVEAGISTVESSITALESSVSSLSTSVASGFSTVDADLAGISSQVSALQASIAKLAQTPQMTVGSGASVLTPSSPAATIYASPSGSLGTVTLTMNTTGVGTKDVVTVMVFTDPSNPTVYLLQTVASKGDNPLFTTTVAAWKVEVVSSFGDKTTAITVNWAYTASAPPS
ncbi:MAG: hypothetical protein JRN21_05295 [Nitrososphaerota archaeon]|nr:hypothetical protein [Nitrososphaerota archaeon]